MTGWPSRVMRTDKGAIIPNVENACLVLDDDDSFLGILSYNQMKETTVMTQSEARPITDEDVVHIQRKLQRLGLARVTKATVHDAIVQIAREHSFHPVRDWLDSLAWDGIARLHGWAHDYLAAEDNAYNNTVGAMFLISMVARIYAPGCKCDHMIILEGAQGTYKSTACRILAGDDYFSDHLPELGDKDVSIHLRGKWVVEIPEMHTFNRAESTALKAFISRTEERYRPPYASADSVEPRQCVFIGTSNLNRYLRDDTGGRRFWPLACGPINIAALARDRDQLFAEAVQLYRDGTAWWPDPAFEHEVIQAEQAARQEVDAWADTLDPYMETVAETTTSSVAKNALGIDAARLTIPDQRRIAAILRLLGWEQKHTRRGNVWIKRVSKEGIN